MSVFERGKAFLMDGLIQLITLDVKVRAMRFHIQISFIAVSFRNDTSRERLPLTPFSIDSIKWS